MSYPPPPPGAPAPPVPFAGARGGAPPPPPPPLYQRGHARGKLGRGILLGAFAGILAVLLGIAAILVTSSAPPAPKPPCPTPPCRQPPKPPSPGPLSPALVAGKVFTSSALGYRLEFDPQLWEITKQSSTDLELKVASTRVTVIVQIHGVPASQAKPEDLVAERQQDLSGTVLGLAEDTRPADRVLEPAVGYQSGVGGAFTGVADTPQGPGSPVAVVIMAATDGKSTVSFTLITDEAVKKPAFSAVDSLMNQFRFPGEIPK